MKPHSHRLHAEQSSSSSRTILTIYPNLLAGDPWGLLMLSMLSKINWLRKTKTRGSLCCVQFLGEPVPVPNHRLGEESFPDV